MTLKPDNSSRKAFFVKCRPQNADIWWLAEMTKRVFIGYPAWRQGYQDNFDPHRVADWVLDLSVPDDVWRRDSRQLASDLSETHKGNITKNRKFARSVRAGSYVVVPRPGQGVVYIGRISQRFEVINDVPWAASYLDYRRSQGLDAEPTWSHVGDVCQGWAVEKWVPFPFARVPRWFGYRLLSRSTIGWLPDWDGYGLYAWDVLDDIYNGRYTDTQDSPTSTAEAAKILLREVTPAAFEHLMCDILQLEYPQLRWWHIGGSGDGGLDGIAMNQSGRVVAGLQCKWKYTSNPESLGRSVRSTLAAVWENEIDVHVATLSKMSMPDQSANPWLHVWDIDIIARKVMEYRDRLPLAKAMGIGG